MRHKKKVTLGVDTIRLLNQFQDMAVEYGRILGIHTNPTTHAQQAAQDRKDEMLIARYKLEQRLQRMAQMSWEHVQQSEARKKKEKDT